MNFYVLYAVKFSVILFYSHVVIACVKRMQQCWETNKSPDCPVCRKKSSSLEPPLNLALKKLCELFVESRHRSSVASEGLCKLHNEKLKLFCVDDRQPVCVVCQTSKRHKNHEFCPIDEVLYDVKVCRLFYHLCFQLVRIIAKAQ